MKRIRRKVTDSEVRYSRSVDFAFFDNKDYLKRDTRKYVVVLTLECGHKHEGTFASLRYRTPESVVCKRCGQMALQEGDGPEVSHG